MGTIHTFTIENGSEQNTRHYELVKMHNNEYWIKQVDGDFLFMVSGIFDVYTPESNKFLPNTVRAYYSGLNTGEENIKRGFRGLVGI